MRTEVLLARRRFVEAMLGVAMLPLLTQRTRAHELGWSTPAIAIPRLACVCSDGRSTTLLELLNGKTTAVQLMFTGCSAICPMQGALYARIQSYLTDHAKRNIQLLSLSIDPLSDDPKALSGWLKRLDAREGWIAAAPAMAALTQMTTLFNGRAAPDTPAARFAVRHDGQLVWRTADLPAPRDVVDLLVDSRRMHRIVGRSGNLRS